MHTVWQSLAWREWHEHKWKLIALSAVMLSLQAAAIWGDPQMVTLVGETAALCAIAPLALYVAMGSAAGERSTGMLAFVRSLPAKRWQMAAMKAAAGISTLLLSLLIAFVAPLVWLAVLEQFGGAGAPEGIFEGLSPFEMLFLAGLAASGLALSCYSWTLACGVNKPTETRAGLSFAAVLIGAAALRVLALQFQEFQSSGAAAGATTTVPTLLILLVRGCDEAGPLGFVSLFASQASPSRVILLQLITWTVLFGWFLYWYGCDFAFEKRSADVLLAAPGKKRPLLPQTIRPGLRTALAAIAWKQSREALPYCLIGLFLIVGIAVWLQLATMMSDVPFAENLAAAGVTAGMMIALLIGIGAFIGELQDGSLVFWRSRPIRPGLWFWTKYATGLLAGAILLAAPIAFQGVKGWLTLIVALPWLAVVYSVSVCPTCWVRHSFYAGVLSFALNLFLLTFTLLSKKWFSAASYVFVIHRAETLTRQAWLLHVYLPYLGCCIFLAVAATFAGWLAVKRDLVPHRFCAAGTALHPSR